MKFDIVVNREQFISRILSPVSKMSSKAVLILEGNRIFAVANLTNASNGQMFVLSDIPMKNTIDEKVTMVVGNVPKVITALKAVKSEMILISYDGTGLEYRSETVSFRIRLSSEVIKIPFNKDKLLSLKINASFTVSQSELREFSSILSGFSNLNQIKITEKDNHVVFDNADRDGVSGESLKFAIEDSPNGHIPDDFIVYNYIFRSVGLSSMGTLEVKIGDAFCMMCSKASSPDGGEIRYILPKLKVKV